MNELDHLLARVRCIPGASEDVKAKVEQIVRDAYDTGYGDGYGARMRAEENWTLREKANQSGHS